MKKRKTRTSKSKVSQPGRSKKDGLVFKAVPKNGQVRVELTSENQFRLVFPARLQITDSMSQIIEKSAEAFWFPTHHSISNICPRWIINELADADQYLDAVRYLDHELRDVEIPVFNAPAGILQTQRQIVWRELQDIPNLVTPKCVRFRPGLPNHFLQVYEQEGFSYPVLIRPVGSHTGADLVIIEKEEDWGRIFSIPWGGSEIYMTQWVDYQSDKGEWRKLRMVITPDRIGLRHVLFGKDWLVHAMERGHEEVERELEIVQSSDSWEAFQEIGSQIRDRVNLDYFGADLGYKSETEFVLFEANASMSILSKANTPEYRQDEYFANISALERDVWRAISRVVEAGRQK